MATFVHLFDARQRRAILRGGIRAHRGRRTRERVVFAFPQLPDYTVTHQWMRELRRFDGRLMLAARFRIPDDEPVRIGRYNEAPMAVTAAEAIAIALEHESALGLEVRIPRGIRPGEIVRIYTPPKVVGWRYRPDAHGRAPCGCPYCQLGQPWGRRLQERFQAEMGA